MAPPVAPAGRRPPDFNLDAEVHQMPDTFLQCRDFGHSWRPYTATLVGNSYEVQLRCSRCKTIRLRTLGLRGQLVKSHYDYAEGYVVKGMGRLDGPERDSLRLESVKRILTEDTAAE